jgi:uncharacterized Zn-binding protein involved in type VI secretion
MPPASRITDMHTCPKVEPGPVPHVGGPVITGAATVLIGNQPAARVTDTLVCVGPPDKVKKGSATVLIDNQEAARIGDPTEHGGVLVSGFATVLIGTTAQAAIMQQAAKAGTPFCEECARRKAAADAERDAQAQAQRQQRAQQNREQRTRPAHAPRPQARATQPTRAGGGGIPAARPGGTELGALSRRYESNGGGPGTIAHNAGDHGGSSYGTYQIATNTGSMRDFQAYLGRNDPATAQALTGARPGSPEFDRAWRGVAERDPQGFERTQHDFIQATHYDPALRRVEQAVPGIDLEQRSPAVREALWSTSVQHGSAGAGTVFRRAVGGADPATLSDDELIQRVYVERGADHGARYFSNSSAAVQRAQVLRYQSEQREARRLLSAGG